jgi:hypothetical protein
MTKAPKTAFILQIKQPETDKNKFNHKKLLPENSVHDL